MQSLDNEHFEAVKTLADIGTKIAAGRAALSELERSEVDFLEGRAEKATQRVAEVLAQSKELLAEISKYHSELVGYRSQVDGFLADVLYLLQSVERWKKEFDIELVAKSEEIDRKIEANAEVLKQVRKERAFLAGESEGIKGKRSALREDSTKINDEWATLGRAKKELTDKK